MKDDPDFYIPENINDLTTSQVLTTEYVEGLPLDMTFEVDQDTRNWVSIFLFMSIAEQNRTEQMFIYRLVHKIHRLTNISYTHCNVTND